MTEDEAKMKWCPMARWSGGTELGADWNTRQQAENRCLASGCMAWRWEYPLDETNARQTQEGYCGLAGQP